MDAVMAYLRELNFVTLFIRLTLAMLFGGILGMERGKKRRPAGFRTYMLVCVGSSLVMATSQYILIQFSTGDPARLGAQVVSGIGFLGAGTIIVTGRNQVRGLTTAAGLWAAACMGLALGIGFYEGAIIGCILLYVTLSFLHRIDERMQNRSTVMSMYVEFESVSFVGTFISLLRENAIKVTDIELSKSRVSEDGVTAAIFSLDLQCRRPHSEVFSLLGGCTGVRFMEEMRM